MRIYLNVTPNTQTVPFNYQPMLVSAFHKWMGANHIHDQLSLYSISWLKRGRRVSQGLDFPDGSTFFISSPLHEIIKKIIFGIRFDPFIGFGMSVQEIILKPTPLFNSPKRFMLQSPVLIKRSLNNKIRFFYPENIESNEYLTYTMNNKLKSYGINETIQVKFDTTYKTPKKKSITYKGIVNKGTLCPIIVEGSDKAIGFAWDVGVGNSTGIGFGALK